MFSGLESPFHLLIVLVIAILVLGPKRIPEVARSLGAGIRHFRESLSGEDSETEDDGDKGSKQPQLDSRPPDKGGPP
jgi:sec-independent protein translocase protein TatA